MPDGAAFGGQSGSTCKGTGRVSARQHLGSPLGSMKGERHREPPTAAKRHTCGSGFARPLSRRHRKTLMRPPESRARKIPDASRERRDEALGWRDSLLGSGLVSENRVREEDSAQTLILTPPPRVQDLRAAVREEGSPRAFRNASVPSCRPTQKVRALRGGHFSPGSGEGQSR